jgi:hypothetical protein
VAKVLKNRTLTNLYNDIPTWLQDLHADLNQTVAAAYGWSETILMDAAQAKLLDLNLLRFNTDRVPVTPAVTDGAESNDIEGDDDNLEAVCRREPGQSRPVPECD